MSWILRGPQPLEASLLQAHINIGWMDVRSNTLKRSRNNRVSPASSPGVQGAVESQTLIISLIVIRTF